MIDWLVSVLSIGAVILLTEQRKEGLYLGLLSQPFWIWIIIDTKQWGLLPVDIAYTLIYIRAILKWENKKWN